MDAMPGARELGSRAVWSGLHEREQIEPPVAGQHQAFRQGDGCVPTTSGDVGEVSEVSTRLLRDPLSLGSPKFVNEGLSVHDANLSALLRLVNTKSLSGNPLARS